MIPTALIGYGWWGRHLEARLAASPRFDLLGISAPELDGDRTEGGTPVLGDYSAVLADPRVQAVILTTPNTVHAEQVQAAAAAGRHVLCEKPLALQARDARAMVAACEAAGVTLGIGHERRFEPAMARVAELVRDGALGTILHAEANWSHDKLAHIPPGDWRTLKATAPAAAMTAMGIHLTDLLLWMLGPVRTVQALTSGRALGWETGDTVTVQLGFAAGMGATLASCLATPHFMRFHLFGAEGWVEVRNDTHPDTPGGQAHLTLSRSGEPPQVESYDWTDTVVANLDAFADAIEGHRPYGFTAAEKIGNIAVLEAITRSAETGQVVQL